MPIIFKTAAAKGSSLEIFGNDYNTKDGTAIRDYIHVEDLCAGHISALEMISQEKGHWIINLGTGRGYSVLDLISTFERVTGKKIPYKFAKRRKGDIESSFADVAKAADILGWKANKNLDDMCRDAWQWASKKLLLEKVSDLARIYQLSKEIYSENIYLYIDRFLKVKKIFNRLY